MKNIIPNTIESHINPLVLVPELLPIHFALIKEVLVNAGYNVELIKITKKVKVVNDDNCFLCYPVKEIINDLLINLKPFKKQIKGSVLLFPDFLFPCLEKNNIQEIKELVHKIYPELTFLFFNSILQKSSKELPLKKKDIVKIIYALNYGDALLSIYYQSRPYELEKDNSKYLCHDALLTLIQTYKEDTYSNIRWNIEKISGPFIKMKRSAIRKTIVSVVGEPCSCLQSPDNTNLYSFLIENGCEVYYPPIFNYVLRYYQNLIKNNAIAMNKQWNYLSLKFIFNYYCNVQKRMSKALTRTKHFDSLLQYKDLLNSSKLLDAKYNGFIFNETHCLFARGSKFVVYAHAYACLPKKYIGDELGDFVNGMYPKNHVALFSYDPNLDDDIWKDQLLVLINEIKKV